ncbi:MAG: response regulator [Desulfoprunum sp.]|nr:response regulator [Desulfoprunum sp.]
MTIVEQQSHILLVEDDRRLIELIQAYLVKQGFRVSTAERGDTAVEVILSSQPDLVILDLMLPGLDGFSVCRQIRPRYRGPILILTAREDDMDQVAGLEMGADDYVKKPIEPRVLLARIRALLRRLPAGQTGNGDSVGTKQFGRLSVCQQSRKVLLEDFEIELTSNEFDLLWILADAAGTILDREYLFKTLRGIDYDGLDRSIDVNISRLRKKLGDSSSHPFRIKTVWGKGYLFVSDAWY